MITSRFSPPTPVAPEWSPTSWQTKPALQQPKYPDAVRVEEVLRDLARLPPLVTSWEIEKLKSQLAEAARGERFLLQGGDCAESFEDCTSESIASKLKILLQMSLVLVHGARRRVIRVGRFAGQYAKPRSDDMETREGVSLPSYRGDLINRSPWSAADRIPDPALLLRGYERAGLTINFIRALIEGGFADLHHTEYWDLAWVKHSPHAEEYHRRVAAIRDSLHFLESLSGRQTDEVTRVDYFTSHEGLHLLYEQAQTRRVPRRPGWYNLSTHFPWIGMRTAQAGGAHVEFFRGLANPIAVKVGSAMAPEAVVELAEVLDPHQEPGRLTFIHRFGHKKIAEGLPPLIEAVRRAGRTVLWVCDPMHGNTEAISSGLKTRRFDHILSELEAAFDIHEKMGSRLGGVHFELTGDDVTECVGGARNLTEEDLQRAYRSQVDPRLNYEQALEMALRIARRMGRETA
ncbi:MAG TPA: 3-deoxy-7-phosphoheptulonate synthase class II [Thermoanaerobaculia bacterium]|nr:3-deoxy-7-phosphoheptulonate synthase class II [Thermoanaerobaculia bacterium]